VVVVALAWLTLPFAFRARLIFDISHFHALLLPFFRSRSTFVTVASSTSITFSEFFFPLFSTWSRVQEPIVPQIRGLTVTAIIGHSSSSRVCVCIYIYIYIFSICSYIYIYLFISHNRYFFARLLRFSFFFIYLFRSTWSLSRSPVGGRGGRTNLERVRKNERWNFTEVRDWIFSNIIIVRRDRASSRVLRAPSVRHVYRGYLGRSLIWHVIFKK